MNKFPRLCLIFLLTVLSFSFSFAGIAPTFTLTVKNIRSTNPSGTGNRDSIIRFDVWLQQTNQNQPGVDDFEYCSGQFTWTYNKSIQIPGSGLIFGLFNGPGANELPPALRPPTFSADSSNGYLKMSGNLPQSLVNYFISGTFPGTRILTAQLRTTASRFNSVPLNLKFKLGASPNTFLSYFLTYPDTIDSEEFPAQTIVALYDTVQSKYSVENGGFTPNTPNIFPPITNFYSNKISIYAGHSINFLDSSSFFPTSWSWTFPGGVPSSSTLRNPTDIIYNIPGSYPVTLISRNSNGSDTIMKADYIHINPNCPVSWKNTIKISDAGNIEDSLILGSSAFGTTGVDSCHGERNLSSVPSYGFFDVRLLSNNFSGKIDIRKDSSEDKEWIMKFQPSISGYPITFTWDTNAFPITGFFHLKDSAEIGFINVNMQSQNSYTLTNPEIHSLKIEYTSKVNISLKIIPEGFYFPLFNLLSRKDSVSIYLRNVTAPFAIIDSAKGIIDSTTFNNTFTFSNTSSGIYYIIVKHLNSIETWSKPGGIDIFTNQIIFEYDFTESKSQAYGNNLQLKSGKYCLYSGDVDQNGFIDLTDLIWILNDSKSFVTGVYKPADLNGDSIIDLTDITLCFNNVNNFIRIRRP